MSDSLVPYEPYLAPEQMMPHGVAPYCSNRNGQNPRPHGLPVAVEITHRGHTGNIRTVRRALCEPCAVARGWNGVG